jgi:hypothetical protein
LEKSPTTAEITNQFDFALINIEEECLKNYIFAFKGCLLSGR